VISLPAGKQVFSESVGRWAVEVRLWFGERSENKPLVELIPMNEVNRESS